VGLSATPHLGGELWSAKAAGLAPNFYEYALIVEFNNGTTRVVGDPCTKYGGSGQRGTCGFVIDQNGYQPVQTRPLKAADRRAIDQQIVYELMLDDFTAEYRQASAPVAAMLQPPPGQNVNAVKYIRGLGFNAIEFMPLTAWSDESFSWGYNPASFFAVEYRYVNDPANPSSKIDGLKHLISACHDEGLQVILDGVFNHTVADRRGRGFAYYWLYQDPADCPFIGGYGGGGFFEELDYLNPCTATFILDVCKYWISEFSIDGFRLDYTKGYYDPDLPKHGLLKLVADLKGASPTTTVTLEHLDGYAAVEVCNEAGADSCWYDPSYWQAHDSLYRLREWVKAAPGSRDEQKSPVQPSIMRLLNSAISFTPGSAPTTYIENHDHAQVASNAEGWANWARTQPWAIALYTMYGAVLCHNGQEMANDYFIHEQDNRVAPRKVLWWTTSANPSQANAATSMQGVYRQLASIRSSHAALTSPGFYPAYWDESWRRFNSEGYGVDCQRALVIYHRYTPNASERIIVVLNFAEHDQEVDVPFSAPGTWLELLSNQPYVVGQSCKLNNHLVPSNWGRIFRL
jgi:1,4-alpha-glucan branching enzyme